MDQSNLNLLPFYAEALSHAKVIHNDIDCLYSKKKTVFYTYARRSEFYDFPIARERSLLLDEYFKKCVGILSYLENLQDDYEMVSNEINSMFKKAYKITYAFFKNKSKNEAIDFDNYMEIIKRHAVRMSDDDLCGHMAAAIYFSMFYAESKNMDKIVFTFWERQQHYLGYRRISMDQITDDQKKQIAELIRSLPYAIDQNLINRASCDKFGFIYDMEDLSLESLMDENIVTKRDIQEVAFAYLPQKNYSELAMDFPNYVVVALHILALLRAYKAVKKEYFKNNKETMYLEISSTQNELMETKSSLQRAISDNAAVKAAKQIEIESLKEENQVLQHEVQRLKAELDAHAAERQEVIALREFVFRQERDSEPDEPENTSVDLLGVRGTIIGGHENWRQKMSKLLPDWNIISPDVTIRDEVLLNSDIVLFNAAHLSHKSYYKAMSILKKTETTDVGYLSNTNTDYALKEILTCITSSKQRKGLT